MKKISSFALLICSASFLGCAGNKPMQYVDKLPMNNKISVGEIVVYSGLEKEEKADLSRPHYAELVDTFRKRLVENLSNKDFSIDGAGCADCLMLKTKINERMPRLGGALGILGLGIVRARVEVYEKDVLVYSFIVESPTDLFFGSATQVRRFVAPEIARQMKKKFHQKGDGK